ncbi:MAG: MFS transporter [Synergistaceae bacterium]|jgi:predicted MFS family arabinose efflux permease|nr:MFS transporter [Synergistaceae bacterium]
MENGKKDRINAIFRVILLTLAGSYIYATYSGIRNNFGIMLNPIMENSHISFTSVSFILAAGQLVFGLVQPAFGIIAAQKGNVYALVSGVILTVTGMILTPLCKSATTLMLCLGFILSAGTGAISYGIIIETITTKVSRKVIPFVSGVINASSGIGNTIFSPITDFLIRTGGLMYGMSILAISVVLTLPVSLLMGKKEKGSRSESAETVSPSLPRTARINIRAMFQKAFYSKTYLYLSIGFFTCGFHMALILNHLPTQIQSFGFSSESTAYAFSIYGIVTMLGSILSGSLCGKFKMKNVLGFYYGLRPITILCFLFIPKTLWTVTLFTALFGFSGAATVPPVSGIIDKTFGTESIATLYGLVYVVHQLGGFFGAWFGGICFDMTGSYTAIWIVGIVLGVAASAISFAIKETQHDCKVALA